MRPCQHNLDSKPINRMRDWWAEFRHSKRYRVNCHKAFEEPKSNGLS